MAYGYVILIFKMFLSSPEDILFIALRERERERVRDIDVKEKHQLVAFFYVPRPGIEHATWVCALTGN